jgi:uncharacterized sulfatase
MFVTHEGILTPTRDRETLASNIDIATTILRACGIAPPSTMTGLDLRDPASLAKRDQIFVDVYEHDSDLDQLDDLDNGMTARVVIDGWDKLIARPGTNELYDLRRDPDDRHDRSAEEPEKAARLSGLIDTWMKTTPPTVEK